MKVLYAAAFALAFAVLSGTGAQAQSAADFGTPPSGKVPLLFNDRHVYAKPDKVTSGRLLAALVKGREILVPLRSLFEQMGATVSYDTLSKTATVAAPSVKVQLTVGVPAVVINGTTTPLRVPPEIVDGDVLVPVRVLVEALGGYVAYIPSIHAVSVRYIASMNFTPPPAPVTEATVAPAPLATAPAVRATVGPGAAIPKGTPEPETFLLVDAVVSPLIANAQAPQVHGASGTSFDVAFEDEFSLVDVNFEFGADYGEYRYGRPAGNVTQPGGSPVAFVNASDAIDRDYEAHVGVQLSPAKYYLRAGYGVEHVDSTPRIGGFGFGLEKLPDLNRHFDYDFDAEYYPNMSGHCGRCNADLAFKRLVYEIGLTYSIKPLFIDAAYSGDKGYSKNAASDDFTHSGIVAGLGLRF